MTDKAFPYLTFLEFDILKHRLSVPDCIAQALGSDDPDNPEGYHPDDVDAVCRLLHDGDFGAALNVGELITFEVLADAVNGSTFYCASESYDDPSDQKLSAIARAGRSLAEKVAELTGIEVTFPTY